MPAKHHPGRIVALLLLVTLTAVLLVGVVNARVVRVCYMNVGISELDRRLDGTKILYVSDLKISGAREARHMGTLMTRLCDTRPDLVLIGGDLCSDSLISSAKQLLGLESRQGADRALSQARSVFVQKMNKLNIPGGIYAVSGDSDPGLSFEEEQRSSIHFLKNESARVQLNGASLPIFGCSDSAVEGVYVFSMNNSGTGPMLVLFHDPRVYNLAVLAAKRRGGAAAQYLFLSGHALNGQVRLGSFALAHPQEFRNYVLRANPDGFFSDENGHRMLLSSGVGSELIPFRLGTRPTAYVITLKSV